MRHPVFPIAVGTSEIVAALSVLSATEPLKAAPILAAAFFAPFLFVYVYSLGGAAFKHRANVRAADWSRRGREAQASMDRCQAFHEILLSLKDKQVLGIPDRIEGARRAEAQPDVMSSRMKARSWAREALIHWNAQVASRLERIGEPKLAEEWKALGRTAHSADDVQSEYNDRVAFIKRICGEDGP